MFGFYGYYLDPTYILVLIGAVICIGASVKLNNTYRRYGKIRNTSGLTGAMAAERILRRAGIYDVRIEQVRGDLTDHYDPVHKVLRLSDTTFNSPSVAAVGVAAHECGHAVQHEQGYIPLKLREVAAPVSNLGSLLGVPLIFVGLLFGMNSVLVQIGLWVFAFTVIFQLITLPIEYNASGRALRMLEEYGIVSGQEMDGCRKVLSAAALTYVAGAAAAILQLLRLVVLFGGRGGDRD